MIIWAWTERDFANRTLEIECRALYDLIWISKCLWSLFASDFDSVTPSTRCASSEELASRIWAVNYLFFGTILNTASWPTINNLEVETFRSLAAGDNGATAKSLVTSHVVLVAIAWESTTSHLFVTEGGHIVDVVSWDVTAHALATNSFHTSLGVLSQEGNDESAG